MVIQGDMFVTDPTWSPPTDWPDLDGLVGLDFETYDPDLMTMGPGTTPGRRGFIVGVALAWNEGRSVGYWPIAHSSGNVDPEKTMQWLKYLAAKPSVTFVAHYSSYERAWLRKHEIKTANPIICTHAAAVILDMNRKSFALDSLLQDYIGERKDERWLKVLATMLMCKPKDVKSRFKDVPAPFVGPYAEQDAGGCLRMWLQAMEPQLREQNLLKPLFDMEIPALDVACEMRHIGVRVDVDEAERMLHNCTQKEAAAIKRIKDLTGVAVDPWVVGSLVRALKVRNIEVSDVTEHGSVSITANWLKSVKDPVAEAILDARKYSKLRTTYADGTILSRAYNGRVHPEWNTIRDDDGGVVTGRISSSNPSLQVIPSVEKDPIAGKAARGLFKPEEGDEWVSADYSQQEPRMLVHFAVRVRCRGADEIAERYRVDPSTDLHKLVAELLNIKRTEAKVINLSIIYGQGAGTTMKKLGFNTVTKSFKKMEDGVEREISYEAPDEEGEALLATYHSGFPLAKAMDKEAKDRAQRRGYLLSLLGRRLRMRLDDRGRPLYSDVRKALNYLVQGSAAEQTKMAMIAMYREGIIPRVQVHDELGVSLRKGDIASRRRFAECMLHAVDLEVPSKIDMEVGSSWGDMVPVPTPVDDAG